MKWRQYPRSSSKARRELTVDYGPNGTRVYRAGDSLLEAIYLPHNGRNTGPGNVRVLAVSMGAVGLADTTPVEKL